VKQVLVCERNTPVARIVPCRPEDYSKAEQRLIARGILTPPLKKRPSSRSWPEPPGNVPDEIMEQVWREERESR
jgi:antitoxin (DNA-binding transcriptional repressor) of toxin-antitoxin stability system